MASSSHSHEELMAAVRELVPELAEGLSKGEAGKVGTIGGCREYTGAPFFASISALKVGADLSHVFCTQGAATVIKGYSPELIVHPYIPDSNDAPQELSDGDKQRSVDKAVEAVAHWLERFDVVVVGPGLGRDELVHATVIEVVKRMRDMNIPMVIDADGLYIVTKNTDLLRGYSNAILTPNKNEFARLAKQLDVDLEDNSKGDQVQQIAAKLGGPIVVQKGVRDAISDGRQTLFCAEEGSKRRAGGQGDVLSGCLAAFTSWALIHQRKAGAGSSTARDDSASPLGLPPLMLAAYGACSTARHAGRLAFAQHKRSMLAGDVITQLGRSMDELYGKSG